MPRLFRTRNERRSDLVQEQCWNIGLAIVLAHITFSCGMMAVFANLWATEARNEGNDSAALKFTILSYISGVITATGFSGLAAVCALTNFTTTSAMELEEEERRMMFDAN